MTCKYGNCSGLTSVTIPSSVTSIGNNAFAGCPKISSIYISDLSAWCKIRYESTTSPLFPSNHHLYLNGLEIEQLTISSDITSLGNYIFYGCCYLTSVTIPNNVTSIGESAFENCSNIETLRLPQDIQIIKKATFKGCRNLKSVTIPASVEVIYQEAFSGCNSLESVKALPETPPFLYDNSFSNYNIPLYASETAIAAYQVKEPWSKFAQFLTLDGQEVETPKCEKPTISYTAGKLTFRSATEGVTYQYSITDSDIKVGIAAEVQLSVSYIISVYAAKTGYDNSEVATATLCWIDVEPNTESIDSGAANVRAQPVLIQSHDGVLTIEGATEGTPISVYNAAGQLVGTATATTGTTTVSTTFHGGNIGIVRIGDRAVKVTVK